MYNNLKLLDCTLRDGGYINNWNWGFHKAGAIIRNLVKAGIDVIEVGFLRNIDKYDADISVSDKIEDLNRLLPKKYSNDIMFSAMAMQSNYDADKLSPYCGHGIEMIRITAHDYDIEDGFVFAEKIKSKGYKVSINPINIMGYSDEKVLWIINKVNEIQPYQFSIVDTFGSMKRRDLERIANLVDHNLNKNIRVALHLHENMSLSCSLAQAFVDMHLNRPISVDGSLMGMGRIPGNLPIELIADYLNDYCGKNYDIDYLLDAICDYIEPMKGKTEWGYNPAYFLSARLNLHRNYAEYYLDKGDLTSRDINMILSRIDDSKTTAFDADYADKLYNEYVNNIIDDGAYRERLKNEIGDRPVLVLAPGNSIKRMSGTVKEYINRHDPCVISVNFIPDNLKVNYVFFANSRRFEGFASETCKTVVTSNLIDRKADYYIDYNSVSGAFKFGCNSLIMLLKLLASFGIKKIALAGADGYTKNEMNYFSSGHTNYIQHDEKYNLEVANAIGNIGVDIEYVTPSKYDVKFE